MNISKRFILNIIFAYLGIIASVLFLELVLYTIPNVSISDNHAQYYLLGLSGIACVVAYFFLEYRKNKKITFMPIVIICGSILLVSGLLAIWLQPSVETLHYGYQTMDVTFTKMDKLNYSLRLIAFIGCLFILIHATTNKKLTTKSFHWMYYIIAALGVISVIISLIIEWDKYVAIATLEKGPDEKFPSIVCVYGNENVYGITLMFSMAALIVVREIKRHWWQLPLFYILLIELIFTSSVTCLLTVGIFFTMFLIYKGVVGIKTRIRLYLTKITIYIVLVIAIVVVLYYGKINDIKPFSNIVDFIIEEILNKNTSTFSGRFYLWSIAGKLISKDFLSIAFGRGYGVSMRLFHYQFALETGNPLWAGPPHIHNGYIDMMMDFGVVGCAIYALGVFYFIKAIIFMFKNKKASLGFIYLSVFIAVSIVASFLENIYPFKGCVNGLAYGGLFLMPPICYMKNSPNYNLIENKDGEAIKQDNKKYPLVLIASILAVIPALFLFISNEIRSDVNILFTIIFVIEILLVTIIIEPLNIQFFSNIGKKPLLKKTIYLIISIMIPALIYVLILFNPTMDIGTVLWLPLVGYVAISLSLMFLFHIVEGKKFMIKNYFSIFKDIAFIPLFALGGAIIVIIACILLNYRATLATQWVYLLLLLVGFAINLFIIFIPNKMPYCYAIDKANQVYNKYEEFFILREREVK